MVASGFVEVITTIQDRDGARALARGLVEKRLVACVQIDGPILSLYRWEGEVHEEEEYRLTCKTRAELLAQVMEFIQRTHTYQVPELWVRRAEQVAMPYAEWMMGQTEG